MTYYVSSGAFNSLIPVKLGKFQEDLTQEPSKTGNVLSWYRILQLNFKITWFSCDWNTTHSTHLPQLHHYTYLSCWHSHFLLTCQTTLKLQCFWHCRLVVIGGKCPANIGRLCQQSAEESFKSFWGILLNSGKAGIWSLKWLWLCAS